MATLCNQYARHHVIILRLQGWGERFGRKSGHLRAVGACWNGIKFGRYDWARLGLQLLLLDGPSSMLPSEVSVLCSVRDSKWDMQFTFKAVNFKCKGNSDIDKGENIRLRVFLWRCCRTNFKIILFQLCFLGNNDAYA